MTHEELLDAIEELRERGNDREGYYTTAEMCEILSAGVKAVRATLHKAKAANRLDVKRVKEPNIAGDLNTKTVYRILPG